MQPTTTYLTAFLARLTGAAEANSALDQIGRSATTGPSGDIDRSTIESVFDPDGTMRLIGVTGIGDRRTAERIADVILSNPILRVHLDLSAVAAWFPEGIDHLEWLLDEAESQGFGVRVVGLDPSVIATARSFPA